MLLHAASLLARPEASGCGRRCRRKEASSRVGGRSRRAIRTCAGKEGWSCLVCLLLEVQCLGCLLAPVRSSLCFRSCCPWGWVPVLVTYCSLQGQAAVLEPQGATWARGEQSGSQAGHWGRVGALSCSPCFPASAAARTACHVPACPCPGDPAQLWQHIPKSTRNEPRGLSPAVLLTYSTLRTLEVSLCLYVTQTNSFWKQPL